MKFTVLSHAFVFGAVAFFGCCHSIHAQALDYNYQYYTFVPNDATNISTYRFGISIGYASYEDWNHGINRYSPTITFTSGDLPRFYSWNNSTVNILGGRTSGSIQVCDSSTLNFDGGNSDMNGNGTGVSAFASSRVYFSRGSIEGALSNAGNSRTYITGGTIGELALSDNSSVNLNGGTIGNFVQVANTSVFNFNSGAIRNWISIANNGTANVSGGTIGNNLNVSDNGTCNFSAGSVGTKFTTNGNSQASISGGSIGNELTTLGNSSVNFSGGSVAWYMITEDNSVVNLSGGSIREFLLAINNSTINLFGTGLSATLINPNGYWSGYYFTQYILAGKLADGTDITGKELDIQKDSSARFTLNNAAVTVTGTLTIEGIVASALPQNVTFTFNSVDGSIHFSRTVAVSPSGTFSFSGLLPKQYTLHIKGEKYLATNVSVNAMNGDVSGMTAFLRAGDANNDNVVDIADLLLLIAHYNQVSPAAGYLNAADFNGDGTNDITDLLLLIGNYNQMGD